VGSHPEGLNLSGVWVTGFQGTVRNIYVFLYLLVNYEKSFYIIIF